MKKLMTVIAAVAMSFGLYATDSINHTVDFAGYSNANPWLLTGQDGATPDALWTWSDTAPAKDEAKIESGKLVLKSGSKTLARRFVSGSDADIGANGLYADMVIDFNNEVLDDVPTVDAGAKLALFAMGGEDAVAIGLPAETNLYVIAAYGDGTALFKLMTDGEEFVGAENRIAVKAYATVTAGSRTGFLIYAGEKTPDGSKLDAVKVDEVYLKNGDAWKKVTLAGQPGDYLGGIAIDAKYSKWILPGQRSLFVNIDTSSAGNGTLTSVDFKGSAKLAKITLTETDPGFPGDSETMPLSLTDATIELSNESKAAGFSISGSNIVGPAFGQDFTFTVDKGKLENVTVKLGENELTPVGTVYTATLLAETALSVEAWDTAATVGTEKFKSLFGDDGAIAYVNENGGTLVLAKGVTAADLNTIQFGSDDQLEPQNIILDLNGETITLNNAAIVNYANLTIIDNGENGAITADYDADDLCAIENYGVLAITDGIFTGEVYSDGTATITGGAFDQVNNPTITPADGYKVIDGTGELTGYWVVVEAPKFVEFTVTYDADKVDNVTVTTNNGVAVAPINSKYTVESNAVVTVAAAAKAGYANVTIVGNNVTVDQDGKFTADKAVSEITISATEIKVTDITLDKSAVTIYVGDTSNVVATIAPAGALVQTVTWDYTALEGFATAQVEGNTIKITGTAAQPVSSSPMVIKATADDVEVTCSISVIAVPAAGPTTDTPGADVKEQDIPGGKIAVVTTTDTSVKEVSISGLGETTTVQVDGQIDSIKGVGEGNAIKVVSRGGTGYIITEFCKITLVGDTATIALDPAKATPVIGEVEVGGEPVAPVSADGTVGFQTKPGLYYTLIAGNEPGAVTTEATDPTLATGTAMKLTADPAKFTPTGAKAFFKVDAAK